MHSDKIWADSTTKNILKYLIRPTYLIDQDICDIWKNISGVHSPWFWIYYFSLLPTSFHDQKPKLVSIDHLVLSEKNDPQ